MLLTMGVKDPHIQKKDAGHILAGLSKKWPKVSSGLPSPSPPSSLWIGETWRAVKEFDRSLDFLANSCLCGGEHFSSLSHRREEKDVNVHMSNPRPVEGQCHHGSPENEKP